MKSRMNILRVCMCLVLYKWGAMRNQNSAYLIRKLWRRKQTPLNMFGNIIALVGWVSFSVFLFPFQFWRFWLHWRGCNLNISFITALSFHELKLNNEKWVNSLTPTHPLLILLFLLHPPLGSLLRPFFLSVFTSYILYTVFKLIYILGRHCASCCFFFGAISSKKKCEQFLS